MKIKIKHPDAFDTKLPRFGYWVMITRIRTAKDKPLEYCIGAHDLNGVVFIRQNIGLSEIFRTEEEAKSAWGNGFIVPGYEVSLDVKNLVDHLINDLRMADSIT